MASDRPQDSSYSVRPGRADDGEDLLRVHRDAILRLGAAAYSVAETESWCADLVAEGYGRAMAEKGELFLVAVDWTDRVIGSWQPPWHLFTCWPSCSVMKSSAS